MNQNNQNQTVRPPAVAGMFYDENPERLKSVIGSYLQNADPKPATGRVVALVSPHAGYPFSGQAAAYGFKLLEPGQVKRVLVIAPSHRLRFRGVSIPPFQAYRTPLGEIPLDREDCDRLLEANNLFAGVAQAHDQEHSLEVQLPFLQVVLGDFQLLPLVVGQLKSRDSSEIAEALRLILKEKDIVVVSSDFTHQGPRFGYVPYETDVKQRIRDLDMGAVDHILQKNSRDFRAYVAETGATICGYEPISILLEMLPRTAQGTLLKYYTSGDILGEASETVSYASIVFENASGWG
ncbi:MAG: AmmeMemoRadiSam system protein B [Deltaproteobacteria bacterium]|nr:AmmeMemoRadiSam system protein B [Deltaproteobacteria bacterium]